MIHYKGKVNAMKNSVILCLISASIFCSEENKTEYKIKNMSDASITYKDLKRDREDYWCALKHFERAELAPNQEYEDLKKIYRTISQRILHLEYSHAQKNYLVKVEANKKD
jgi:hypothetical protein